MKELKIKGCIKNKCKRCGKVFTIAYYENEDPRVAKLNYCHDCFLPREDWAEKLLKV